MAFVRLVACPAPSRGSRYAGIVEWMDTGAKAITIAHEPVQALEWPAMTMTFQAPDANLASIRPGDRVAFEFTATGMEGTIIRISRQ